MLSSQRLLITTSTLTRKPLSELTSLHDVCLDRAAGWQLWFGTEKIAAESDPANPLKLEYMEGDVPTILCGEKIT